MARWTHHGLFGNYVLMDGRRFFVNFRNLKKPWHTPASNTHFSATNMP